MVETVAERLSRLEKAHQEVDDIVLGRWDFVTGKRRSGLAEQLNCLTEEVKTISKILKWGIGPLITLCTAASVGSSLKEILPTLAKIVISIAGLK